MQKVITGIIFILMLAFAGCASQTDKLLSDVGYKFGYQCNPYRNCREKACAETAYLKDIGIEAEVVHCKSRSPYEWDHAICRAKIDGVWWVVPDYLIMDVPWQYDEVKKYCYAFILP